MPLILAVRNSAGIAGAVSGEAIAPLRIERGEIVIGRGAGVGLQLSSPAVSRRHCTVSGEGVAWRIVDTSSGGTFVNGQRLSGPHFLRHADVITVGDVEVAVMLDQSAQPFPAPAPAPTPAPAPARPAAAAESWGRPAGAGASPTQMPSAWGTAAAAPAAAGGQDVLGALLNGAGLSRTQVGGSDQHVAAAAGAALRAALSGLVRLAQDRRKAREDLGIAAAGSEAGELSSAGSADELLLRLLALPPADAAAQVAALCRELDAHQRAVLAAMQESFHHSLDQFSPKSIKNNARGDAEAWKTYERAFEAKDGFVEVFAEALARNYAEALST